MKKQFLRIGYVFAASLLLLAGCQKDINPDEGQYGPGIFVVNEGSFGNNNASVSFINREDGEAYNDIYSEANGGVLLGDVAQCLTVHDGKAFIVVNNSSKIEVVDVVSFEHIATISGLQLPRYMVVKDDKAYVTEWINFGVNGQVSVVDLSTYTVTDSIAAGIAPEQMLLDGNSLFVTNSNDNTLTKINTTNNTVSGTATIGDWPASIRQDANGKLWVLCGGVPSWAGTATSGSLVVLDPSTLNIERDMDFGSTSANPSFLGINNAGTQLFYHFNGGIYSIGNTATVLPGAPLFSAPASIYGLGVDPVTDYVYVADAGNFSSSGWVRWYTAGGTVIDSANVGVAPNGFYFHE
jgi:YVTN family beta-propeller protein